MPLSIDDMTIQKLAYTFEEAADQCGYPVGTLKQAVADGNLVARYVKTTGVIRHEDLAAWVAQLPTKPSTGTTPVNRPNTGTMPIENGLPVPNQTGRPPTVDRTLPEPKSGWLTPEDVGHLLQLSPGTLSNWRSQRRGPEFKRIEGVVRYDPAIVEAWIKAQPSK